MSSRLCGEVRVSDYDRQVIFLVEVRDRDESAVRTDSPVIDARAVEREQ